MNTGKNQNDSKTKQNKNQCCSSRQKFSLCKKKKKKNLTLICWIFCYQGSCCFRLRLWSTLEVKQADCAMIVSLRSQTLSGPVHLSKPEKVCGCEALTRKFNDDANLGIYIRSAATLLAIVATQCCWDQPGGLLLYWVGTFNTKRARMWWTQSVGCRAAAAIDSPL